MGTSTIMDIIGSIVIGGLLMLILFRLTDTAAKNTFKNGGELIVQQNLTTLVQILEHDFRQIGYCQDWTKIPNPSQAILNADTSSIRFLTDMDNDGNVDTLSYSVGDTTELTVTPNPRDRYLYRVLNSATPNGANLGVTVFRLRYYDALGNEIATPVVNTGQIATIKILLAVENVAAYDNDYSTATWQQVRLPAPNLQNR